MKVSYDKEVNAVYIQFKGETVIESDKDKSGGMIIDNAADGSVVGIKILNTFKTLSLPVQPDYLEV